MLIFFFKIKIWTSVYFQDKKDIPWWLGISYKGIGVYDKNDKNVPRKVGHMSYTVTAICIELILHFKYRRTAL